MLTLAFALVLLQDPVRLDLDVAPEAGRTVVVDREEGQYLGHPTTLLLEDGRTILTVFPRGHGKGAIVYRRSTDGGRTWGEPRVILETTDTHLCEPGAVRSPDGSELTLLLRENRRVRNSFALTPRDEGETWSEPHELSRALTGDRHVARYAPDGRLVVTFRDMAEGSPTHGDWVAWVGRYEDIAGAGNGQYRVRLQDNHVRCDCGYPGLELLPDGTFVAVSYGHWTPDEPPYVIAVRFKLEELDALAAGK